MILLRKIIVGLLLTLVGLWGWGAVVYARQDSTITTKIVQFKPGKSSATYSGTVRGYNGMRYELAGKAGQRFAVKLTSKNRFVYFNVLNKRTDVALESDPAPREVTNWSGVLPETGRYIVDVYLVRAEARRKGKADFKLSLEIRGTGTAPTNKSD